MSLDEKRIMSVVMTAIAIAAIAILSLILSSCSTTGYKSFDPVTGHPVEEFSMTTWFKSVENVSVLRSPEVFGLQIGSTSNDDIFGDIAKIIGEYK